MSTGARGTGRAPVTIVMEAGAHMKPELELLLLKAKREQNTMGETWASSARPGPELCEQRGCCFPAEVPSPHVLPHHSPT